MKQVKKNYLSLKLVVLLVQVQAQLQLELNQLENGQTHQML